MAWANGALAVISSSTRMPRLTASPRAAGERDVGANADRDDHEIGGEPRAVGEDQRFGPRFAGDLRPSATLSRTRTPLRSTARLRKEAERASSWRSIKPVHPMDERDRGAALGERHRPPRCRAGRRRSTTTRRLSRAASRSAGEIGEIAEGRHAGQVHAGDRRAHCSRSGGEDDAIEGDCSGRRTNARRGARGPAPRPAVRSVRRKPCMRYQSASRSAMSASSISPASKSRQQHAIIARARLRADDRRRRNGPARAAPARRKARRSPCRRR